MSVIHSFWAAVLFVFRLYYLVAVGFLCNRKLVNRMVSVKQKSKKKNEMSALLFSILFIFIILCICCDYLFLSASLNAFLIFLLILVLIAKVQKNIVNFKKWINHSRRKSSGYYLQLMNWFSCHFFLLPYSMLCSQLPLDALHTDATKECKRKKKSTQTYTCIVMTKRFLLWQICYYFFGSLPVSSPHSF